MNTRKTERKKLTPDDIVWREETINGQKELMCTAAEAAAYLDVTPPALTSIMDENAVTRYELGYGSVKLILKRDLDALKQVRPANGARVSVRLLLEQAAMLLEQMQTGQSDAEAIAKWLEAYQQIK